MQQLYCQVCMVCTIPCGWHPWITQQVRNPCSMFRVNVLYIIVLLLVTVHNIINLIPEIPTKPLTMILLYTPQKILLLIKDICFTSREQDHELKIFLLDDIRDVLLVTATVFLERTELVVLQVLDNK